MAQNEMKAMCGLPVEVRSMEWLGLSARASKYVEDVRTLLFVVLTIGELDGLVVISFVKAPRTSVLLESV